MDAYRTPDSNFTRLPGYDFEPRYCRYAGRLSGPPRPVSIDP